MSPRTPVGIEKIRVYPGALSLDLELLARARGHDPADLRDNLLVSTRSLNPLWEDPVTMAVNAAQELLTDEDRATIELIVVATESSVDQSKSIAAFAHRYLGIQPHCRVLEVKQACYAGTSALMLAAHWVAAGVHPGARALVICTDESRAHLHKPYEYVMGAGAVAMVVSADPRVLELELHETGYFAAEASDTFRPTSRVETGNGETSLYCYMDALEGAWEHFVSRAGPVDLDEHFARHIYHVPFGGITFQAHRTLIRSWRRMNKRQAWEHFARKSLPALRYARQIGSTYAGSVFVALVGLLDAWEDLEGGERISVFSYGSGSVGELYSAVVGPEAHALVATTGLQATLDARHTLDVAQYEALELERFERIDQGSFEVDRGQHPGLWDSHYQGRRRLVLEGNTDHFRRYGWS